MLEKIAQRCFVYAVAVIGCYSTSSHGAEPQAWLAQLSQQQQQHPVTLTVQEMPLQTLLQLLADDVGINVVVSEALQQRVQLRFNQVPWREAMRSLITTYQLDVRVNGSVYSITQGQPITQPGQARTMVSELLTINFANAAKLAELLASNEQKFLSADGAVSVDERTNTLILRDYPERLRTVKALLKSLDIPVKQVMIEARMVTLKSSASEELGVRWGLSPSGLQRTAAGGGLSYSRPQFEVNLPTVAAAGSLTMNIGKLHDNLLLDLELSALERENQAQIIASPKIFTANQQPAYIEQGSEIPYVESAASGATAVQFKKAVMGLKVTPQITPNDHVLLNLVMTQNTRGETVSTPTGPAVAIDTQEMGTQVLVKSGETIVLGGIFQRQALHDQDSVPLLSKLPLVGKLFSHQRTQADKRELLIFVTPTIVDEQAK
ncbi:type IV pilus secretin PilQ [Idiomarina tyrosinivorans]|uniref:Type IV pilus secretin PilQ n=1 Tax=Idiomarina tyrosinivorans TaxID=1445662 RepID=A0A432ZPT7_9GAMM|nr:type IV pilus secretin PilQ [Idiomarina tyrosinivorans]